MSIHEWDDGRIQMGFRGEAPAKTEGGELEQKVLEALRYDSRVEHSEIEVTVEGGSVTLSGSVPERKMKYIAETCVEAVRGVHHVNNEIRVQAQPAPKADNL